MTAGGCPRYLVTADPLERLDPRFDLGVFLSEELLRRGARVDYLDLEAVDPPEAMSGSMERLPVRRVLAVDRGRRPPWELGPVEPAPATAYGVILHRKDPPVDRRYRAWHEPFASLPGHVIQVNRPPATYELSEHTVHLRFPRWAVPTRVCRSLPELAEAVRATRPEAVLKPLNTYCGMGVSFVPSTAAEGELAAYWERWGPEVTVQPYLEAVTTDGDIRVLTIGSRILGAVRRLPPEGSRLANLHAGGLAAPAEVTPELEAACREVAAALGREGLLLLGLDFIGGYLTEINFTSPTLLVQIEELSGSPARAVLADELERLWRERRGG